MGKGNNVSALCTVGDIEDISPQVENLTISQGMYVCIVAKSHCLTVRLKILGIASHQTLIISLQNWVKGRFILMTTIAKSVQPFALNLPVVYRYTELESAGWLTESKSFFVWI